MSSTSREHPSTYFVKDRSNEDEMRRVALQDQMSTISMGGVLPEQADPSSFTRVLDVGCGTGGWLLNVAQDFPDIALLLGVDISERMIAYAQEQANDKELNERVQYRAMDALRMLEFPSNFFDLVNQRFALSYLRTWDWPKLLREFQRVARPGGTIRLTEVDIIRANSEALNTLANLLLHAFHQAGHFFAPEPDGITSQLARLLQQYGVQNIQTCPYTIEYRPDTETGRLFIEDIRFAYRTIVPFLRKWTKFPEDYEELYQQALLDMQKPDFVATCTMLTAWGQVRAAKKDYKVTR